MIDDLSRHPIYKIEPSAAASGKLVFDKTPPLPVGPDDLQLQVGSAANVEPEELLDDATPAMGAPIAEPKGMKISYPEFCIKCSTHWPVGWGLPVCYKCMTEDSLRAFLKVLDLKEEGRNP